MTKVLEDVLKFGVTEIEVAALKLLNSKDVGDDTLNFHNAVEDIYSCYKDMGLQVPEGIGSYIDDEYMTLLEMN